MKKIVSTYLLFLWKLWMLKQRQGRQMYVKTTVCLLTQNICFDVRWMLKQRCVLANTKHLFWRQYNIIWTLWTSDGRWNNVVCLLTRNICFDVNRTSFEHYGRQMDIDNVVCFLTQNVCFYVNTTSFEFISC